MGGGGEEAARRRESGMNEMGLDDTARAVDRREGRNCPPRDIAMVEELITSILVSQLGLCIEISASVCIVENVEIPLNGL